MAVKVSVLMPIYKTNELFLKQAIESILSQTFSDFEFLILDDCPEDTREEIVKSYNDKRIKYSKNNYNMGITPSRNKLISLAKGEYLAVFDHDDISLPERLEKQVGYLDKNPDVGVVSCPMSELGSDKVTIYPQADADIRLALVRSCAIVHSAAMIRKKVLMENNLFYEEKFSPAEDYGLFVRLMKYTKFHNLSDVLFKYRNHQGNTSHKQANRMRNATYAIWALIQTQNPELYTQFLYRATYSKQYKLFGLPLFSVKKKDKRTTVKLFGLFPIIKTEETLKMQKG